MYLLVAKQLFTMAIIGIGGFIFAKVFKVQEKEQKFLSKLLLYFINPCLVVNTFNIEFQSEKMKQFGFVILMALIIHLVMIGVSFIFTISRKQGNASLDQDYNKLDRLLMTFTNCGFVGIPLIRGVFGDEGVFFLMGYLVIFNSLVWSYGLSQMCGRIDVKKIITNPNIIAVCLGLILFRMPFTLPDIISRPLSMIGDLNTATAMILIGILFADFKIERSYSFRLIKTITVRLVINALVNLGVLALIYILTRNFIDSRMMIFVVYICSMCPSATSIPGLACLFDKDARYASLVVSVTSLMCILTVPLFVALAEQIIN